MKQPPSTQQAPIGALYVASIFSSAFLLFLIQPLVARMLLPRFGGTPAVWNTALVFFQCALLAGYAYAHLSLRILGERRQLMLQAVVIVLPLLVLPPAVATVARLADSSRPVWSVMLVLAVLVGLPFFVLASNSSLIQRWYSLSGLAGGREPYRLYAASNFGSMLALLAYPLAIAPVWGLGRQASLWSMGYLVFIGLTLAVMGYTLRGMGRTMGPAEHSPAAGESAAEREDIDAPPLSRSRRLGWVVRAAIAVSLLLSTTMQITTDIAPVPLLWIAPLALYLATFIIAFARPTAIPRRFLAAATIACVTLSLSIMLLPGSITVLWIKLALPLLTLTAGALLCHVDIARDQPAPRYLTEYYLWIALGGAVGGILNSLVAPVVFSSVTEYPITLALLVVAMILPPGAPSAMPWRELRRPAAWVLMIGMAAAAAWSVAHIDDAPPALQIAIILPQLILILGLLVLWLSHRRRAVGGRWAYAYAVILAVGLVGGGYLSPEDILDQGRSFFGVMRVIQSGDTRSIYHGTILHGSQWLDPARRGLPRKYFHPRAPLGSLARRAADDAAVGVVGLGAGALAAHCRPGQTMTFFEIDPLVDRMARDYFSFLADARCQIDVIYGDGRLSLVDQPDHAFDLLYLDAFSSDAVPIHLLTTEALATYVQKLRPQGLLVFHISNRYVDLRPVLSAAAQQAGLAAAMIAWEPDEQASIEGASPSDVVAMSPDPAVIERLIRDEPGWQPLRSDRSILWTDDHADLLSVLEW